MYITYHQEIEKPSNVDATISHEVLSNELKEYIKDNEVIQERYYFRDNGHYFFIYLDNGDRIDVKL